MITLRCLHCQHYQSPLDIATNKAFPDACICCGHKGGFAIPCEDVLTIYKMEQAAKSFAMILDGAYS